jgi:hypothetical protein
MMPMTSLPSGPRQVVLPTIKNEMNLLRSRYAAAIKNQIIHGKVIRIVGCASACN